MEAASSLGHVPAGERWQFDETVASVFDDMLERSIPQYRIMRDAVHTIGRRFVQPDTAVVDLGCSRGEALSPFVHDYQARNEFVGVECSKPMAVAARERFEGDRRVTIFEEDLRSFYPETPASVTLAVLTLQFVPINYRQRIVRRAFANTVSGGVFIVVEKLLGDLELDDVFVDTYHASKRASGYTPEEVERKRLSLEGVLVPVTARWNEELLRESGFVPVDCFWRWMNFAGWVAVKP